MATLSPRCCLVASRLHQTRCRASRSHAGPTKEAQHVRGSRREAYTRSSAASLHPRPEPVTKPVHRRVRQNLWVPRWCMRLQGGGQTKESALDEHEVDEGCPVFRRTTVTHIVSSLDPSWVESRVRRRMFGFARRWKQFILCTFWALAALDFAEVEGSGAGVRKIVRAASGDQGTPEAQRRGTFVGRSSGISTRAPPTRTPRITVRLFRAQNTVSSKPCSLRGAMLRRHCFRSSSACYAVRCQ